MGRLFCIRLTRPLHPAYLQHVWISEKRNNALFATVRNASNQRGTQHSFSSALVPLKTMENFWLNAYAQHPGRLSGMPTTVCGGPAGGKKMGGSNGLPMGGEPGVPGVGVRNFTTDMRFSMTRSHTFMMSPEVRKKLYGHQPGPI